MADKSESRVPTPTYADPFQVRIPTKPATHSDLKPAGVPI